MSKSKIKYLKLPITFDVGRLQHDLEKALKFSWQRIHVEYHFEGDWNAISLISPGGTYENIYAVNPDDSEPQLTQAAEECAYFKSILEGFGFPITSARLMRLAPKSYIKPHFDNDLGYGDGYFRLHLPIVTHKDIEFIVGGDRVVMDEGTLWYMNANHTHSVANNGNTARVHLVIDGVRNEASDKLFLAVAKAEDFIPEPVEPTQEEKRMMIENLKIVGSPLALEMMEKLLKEIDE